MVLGYFKIYLKIFKYIFYIEIPENRLKLIVFNLFFKKYY